MPQANPNPASLSKSSPESLFTLVVDRWTKPFWDAAAERRLVAPRCSACGRFRMPPTPFCPHCLSQDLDWPTLSGRGTIYSYTIVNRAIIPEMESALPYVPALVELPDAGGIRLVTNIVGASLDRIHIGAPVAVAWETRSDGVVLPRFEMVEDEAAAAAGGD